MATRDDIKKAIAYLKLVFPNFNPILEGEPNSIDVYLDLLADLPAETLQAGIRACGSEIERAFAPSPGEIRGAAIKLHMKASDVPSAGEAWGEIIGSFERMPGGNMAGGGHTPILDHPLVRKAVHCMGGYSALSNDFFDNQMANRAHFLRIYGDLLETWKDDAAELPALTDYIQEHKRIGGAIALLTDKMAVKK